MDWKDIKEIVGKSAPMLGALLAPVTGGASVGIGAMIASALGVENTPDAVHKALTIDPEAAIKLKQLEVQEATMLKEHLHKMATVDLEYERSRVEERKSAHSREIGLAQAGKANNIQPLLAFTGVATFFALTWYVVSVGMIDMTQETAFIVGSLIGSVSMIAKDIYGYYFGSSQGSKDKTDKLSQAQQK